MSEQRILRINTCPSLSGRTSITYHVGYSEVNEVSFRIWATSGKGVFSKEWVSAAAIDKVLRQHKLLAAPSLLPVFKVGRSVNTAGYLLAVLKEEGLVALPEDTAHKYVRRASEKFTAEVAKLIEQGVSLDSAKDPAGNAPAAKKAGKRGKPELGAAPWDANSPDNGTAGA